MRKKRCQTRWHHLLIYSQYRWVDLPVNPGKWALQKACAMLLKTAANRLVRAAAPLSAQ